MSDSLPWYKDGLSFSCTQCGKCCTGAPGRIAVSEQEMNAMADFLQLALKDFKRLYVKRRGQDHLLVEKRSLNHDCVFFKDNKCSVYPVRPRQCKTYPFWQENLNSPQSWALAAEECEGISTNPNNKLYILQEIQSIAQTD